jgi:hypothetical protein
MTDPAQAMLWLLAATITVLVICLGGTLMAAGLWPRRSPGRRRSTQRGAVRRPVTSGQGPV